MSIAFYGTECQERLTATSVEEVFEQVINEDSCIENIEKNFTIYKFENIKPDAKDIADTVLENLLENLDDEYSDPDGDFTDATDAMKQASLSFVKTVLKDYHVWACERVEDFKIYAAQTEDAFYLSLYPQPPKEITDNNSYCEPYNKNPEKFTFWTNDNKMRLLDGSIKNTAHWKPPLDIKKYGIPTVKYYDVGLEKGWYWVYKKEQQ